LYDFTCMVYDTPVVGSAVSLYFPCTDCNTYTTWHRPPSQKHFTDIPHGLDAAESRLLQRRRKAAIRVMSEMSVLDVARGKQDEMDTRKANKRAKEEQFD
jgi:hypothetical protein